VYVSNRRVPTAIDLVCASGGYDGFWPNMTGLEEIDRSKPALAPLFAMLQPHQKAVLLPGVFGCGNNQSYFGAPDEQARRVVRKLDGYLAVRAAQGRLSARSAFSDVNRVLYGAFVWACRALNSRKRRFPARAVGEGRAEGRRHGPLALLG
jgi:hypothetical protein